jgi:hypothetical protein
MLKWSNEVITWSNEAFWLDDLEIHDRRRACDLQAVNFVAEWSFWSQTYCNDIAASPFDRRLCVRKRSQLYRKLKSQPIIQEPKFTCTDNVSSNLLSCPYLLHYQRKFKTHLKSKLCVALARLEVSLATTQWENWVTSAYILQIASVRIRSMSWYQSSKPPEINRVNCC